MPREGWRGVDECESEHTFTELEVNDCVDDGGVRND